MNKPAIAPFSHFQPRQIVYLEHEETRLYAEVIQVITERQMCWVRPWMLVVLLQEATNSLPPSSGQPVLYDLRQDADLVWPINLFRPALDTEVIPLLLQLDNPESQLEKHPVAHEQLSYFIHQVWQAYKGEF